MLSLNIFVVQIIKNCDKLLWCSAVHVNKIIFLSLLSRISKSIPTTKDVEPLLEIDGDIRSFEVFLSSRTPVLTARDVEMFLPCTVNLDPKLREIIAGPYTLSSPCHTYLHWYLHLSFGITLPDGSQFPPFLLLNKLQPANTKLTSLNN